MYSITRLSGGNQLLLAHNLDILSAIEIANDYARTEIEHSAHTKKTALCINEQGSEK